VGVSVGGFGFGVGVAVGFCDSPPGHPGGTDARQGFRGVCGSSLGFGFLGPFDPLVGDGLRTACCPNPLCAMAVPDGATTPRISTTAPAASHGVHEPIVSRRERLVLEFIVRSHPVVECRSDGQRVLDPAFSLRWMGRCACQPRVGRTVRLQTACEHRDRTHWSDPNGEPIRQ
jgi:hypothetical protein